MGIANSDATVMAVAGSMSRCTLEHYSHIRIAAKREALTKHEGGLMGRLTTDAGSTLRVRLTWAFGATGLEGN